MNSYNWQSRSNALLICAHIMLLLVFQSRLLITQSATDSDAGDASTSVFLIDRQAAKTGSHQCAAQQ